MDEKKGAEPEEGGGKGRRRGVGLTTADAEEKCDVEEGVTRDDDLNGMAIKSGTRTMWASRLEKRRREGRVTYSDQRSDSTDAAPTKKR